MSVTQESLLPAEQDEDENKKTKPAATINWLFVSNHVNLSFLLAEGLISTQGNIPTYYQDTLNIVNGWIPLFAEGISLKSAIKHSISESNMLIPCIASLNLSRIEGHVKSYNNGAWEILNFVTDDFSGVSCILFPAPLPVSYINDIKISSKTNKQILIDNEKDFSNIPLSLFQLKVSAKHFKQKDDTPLSFLSEAGFQPNDTKLDSSSAAGAVVAVLFHLSNRNTFADKMFASITNNRTESTIKISSAILNNFKDWLENQDSDMTQLNTGSKIFLGLASKLIQEQNNTDYSTHKDIALQSLKKLLPDNTDKTREARDFLIDDLDHLLSFPNATAEELLAKHKKPLSRGLLLFFLNDSLESLLEFDSPQLNEEDVVLAAILFAVSSGWFKLPKEYKLQGDLTIPGALFMERLAGRSVSNLNLTDEVTFPVPIRTLLNSQMWDKKQKEAALLIAKTLNWDCIKTRIKLAKGQYGLDVSGSGIEIIIDGEVNAVETEAIHEDVLIRLKSIDFLPLELEKNIRNILKD